MKGFLHLGWAVGALALVGFAVVVLCLPAAGAASSRVSGTIAFARGTSAGQRIWTMWPDGSHQRVITPKRMFAIHAALSPDGRRLLFVRFDTSAFQGDVYVIGSDGSSLRRLTSAKTDETSPSWSPDGKRIAYVCKSRSGRYDIWVMNSNGSGKHRLASIVHDGNPSWSPDGRKIAYASGGRIWVMNADGHHRRQLTAGSKAGADDQPTWSPDSRRIAYASNRGSKDQTADLWLMAADGSHKVRLMHSKLNDYNPAWSPDGRWLAFARSAAPSWTPHIWLIRPDGRGLRQLTHEKGTTGEVGPSWSR